MWQIKFDLTYIQPETNDMLNKIKLEFTLPVVHGFELVPGEISTSVPAFLYKKCNNNKLDEQYFPIDILSQISTIWKTNNIDNR